MLGNDFFQITELQKDDLEVKATFIINAGHAIFDGHFPGQPVVPGVCMMQMLKELVEQVMGQKSNLIKAHDMKFLAVIDPQLNNNIQVTLKYFSESDGTMSVSASLYKETLIHFKFKGQFSFL